MQSPGEVDVTALARLARRAERRMRLLRALEVGTRALAVALVVAVVTVALRKTAVMGPGASRALLVAAALGVLVAALLAFTRRLPPRAGAMALDRHHGLAGRLASALAFAEAPAEGRTGFMAAAIADGVEHGRGADPRRAVPLRRPTDLPFTVALAAGLALVAALEVRRPVPVATLETLEPVEVTPDDVDALREFLREMEQRATTDEAKVATQEFNQLIRDLEGRRLDRTEAFRRMQALEDKLLDGREADAKALEAALEKMGEELKKADLAKPAGEALESKNLAVAEKALRDLAKKLREQGADKGQLEKLREALKKASESQSKRLESLAQRRAELRQELLRQKQKQSDAGAEEEKSLLKKKERELERLDRDLQDHQGAQRQLDRLDRELAEAAEDLMKDLGLSAEDLEEGAEDINRMARQQMSQEEKEQLRKKLHELREMLRQQGQGGQKQMQRLRRFQQAARGGAGKKGQRGEQGDGKKGQEGQEGEGNEGEGSEPGEGQGKPGERWVLGPNGEKILMLSSQRRAGGSQGGQGDQKGGEKGYGTGHDSRVQGAATDLKGTKRCTVSTRRWPRRPSRGTRSPAAIASTCGAIFSSFARATRANPRRPRQPARARRCGPGARG